MRRTIKDLVNLKGKVVLVRVDFNVPIDKSGRVLDATRIMGALPTIQYLVEKEAKVVVMSHLGRPNGYEINKSLWQVYLFLMSKLKCKTYFVNDCIGKEVKDRISTMENGTVLLLENLRFHEGETKCDMDFAKKLASLGDIFVMDAFGVAHRKHASSYGVARILPNAMGFLVEKESQVLDQVLTEPKRPFVAVLGGAKVEGKIKVLETLLEKCDTLLIGGAMAYTFLVAKGIAVGHSMLENESVIVAKRILKDAEEKGKKIYLPVDHIAYRDGDKKQKSFTTDKLVEDMVGCDIGPKTISLFTKLINGAGEILWNGPLGMYEDPRFQKGTAKMAKAIAQSPAYTVVAGGDSVSAVKKSGFGDRINYFSTGGGATLKYIESGSLPCLDVIQERLI